MAIPLFLASQRSMQVAASVPVKTAVEEERQSRSRSVKARQKPSNAQKIGKTRSQSRQKSRSRPRSHQSRSKSVAINRPKTPFAKSKVQIVSEKLQIARSAQTTSHNVSLKRPAQLENRSIRSRSR